MPEQPPTEVREPSRKPVIIILALLIITLLGTAVFLGYQYFKNQEIIRNQSGQMKEKDQAIDTLTVRYDEMLHEVDTMYIVISGLKEEKKMLEADANRYLAELEDLRKQLSSARRDRTPLDNSQMRETQARLQAMKEETEMWKEKYDALMKEKLFVENQKRQVEDQLKESNEEVKNLSQDNEDLQVQLRKAAEISAFDISAKGVKVKKNGERIDEKKAKKAEKIRVNVALQENKLAYPGERDIYFVITTPDGNVLAGKNTFNYKGKDKSYSSHERVQYSNTKAQVYTEVSARDKFAPGTYEVDVYLDDHSLGSTSFVLE